MALSYRFGVIPFDLSWGDNEAQIYESDDDRILEIQMPLGRYCRIKAQIDWLQFCITLVANELDKKSQI